MIVIMLLSWDRLPDSFVKSHHSTFSGLKGQNIIAQGNALGE